MFENAGGKIKTLAATFFVFGIIGSIICAIVFGKTPDRYGDPQFNFLSFILILAAGGLGSFISCLFLYTFGDIAENVQAIASATAETAKRIKALEDTPKTPPVPASKPVGYFNSNAAATGSGNQRWVCKKCGTKNDMSSMYCKDCGEYR